MPTTLTADQTIWVTDAELIRRSGVPEKIMRANLRALDANPHSGFPKKDKLWGGRRHWPSVQKYWEDRENHKAVKLVPKTGRMMVDLVRSPQAVRIGRD